MKRIDDGSSLNFAIRFKALLIALLAGLMQGGFSAAKAIQLTDGTVYFAHPPELVGASTTFQSVRSPSTYYFTIRISETAGEPLQTITLTQQSGVDTIAIDVKDSYAFEGTRDHEGVKLPTESIVQDPQTKAVSVIFSPPINPGKEVTLNLQSVRNPEIGGVYLFGVTAFPAGKKSYGQFLGYGRLQFYSSGGGGIR